VQAQPLPGTEGAAYPFWSPDGRFLGFFAGGKLKRVDTAGGEPQILCDATNGRGGSWNRDGVIVFSAAPNSPINRIGASGGAVTAVTKLDPRKSFGHNWPQFLPDGRHFLFYHRSAQIEEQGVYVASLDSPTVTRILPSGSMGLYANGHLLFVRDGILFAQPFDDRALRTTGEPVRMADRVGYFNAAFGYVAVTASTTDVVVYGPGVALTTQLRWLDRRGAAAGPATPPAVYSGPRISPDQTRVAVAITDATTPKRDIWVMDVARGTTSRATFDPAPVWFPTWSADGSTLFFGSTRPGATSIFRKAVAGQDELLYSNTGSVGAFATYPTDASADGRLLLYTLSSSLGYDLAVLALSKDREASVFLATPFNEAQGRFSPDTRWIAYASDESGRFEVYVRPFPARDEQWKVSLTGGTQPEWRRDGKELFYISADRKLMAVSVATEGNTLVAGSPHALFDVEIPEGSAPYPTDYAVSADGQRFLVNTVVEQTSRPTLTVVLNWTAELGK